MSEVSALFVADYIIAKKQDHYITQVIKLTYISHGFTLALLDRPLISDVVEAWTHGPVIPSLYHHLHMYRGKQIPCLTYCGTPLTDTRQIQQRVELVKKVLGVQVISIIDRVLELYGGFSADDLSSITHKDGTPWTQYYDKNVVWNDIPNDAIKKHYKDIINNGGR